MLLQRWIGRWVVGLAAGWNFEGESVGEVEAYEGLGFDLDLFAACDGVDSGSGSAAGSGSETKAAPHAQGKVRTDRPPGRTGRTSTSTGRRRRATAARAGSPTASTAAATARLP